MPRRAVVSPTHNSAPGSDTQRRRVVGLTRRWLAAHPRASVSEAWRAGWYRAWSIVRDLLRDWRQRWEVQAREISSLRLRIGVLIMPLSEHQLPCCFAIAHNLDLKPEITKDGFQRVRH
jgi:hypothetical protein